jgi:hypothetical protein
LKGSYESQGTGSLELRCVTESIKFRCVRIELVSLPVPFPAAFVMFILFKKNN